MPDLTRRTFLGASAAIPFSVWLQGCTPAGPRVRYDARSAQGQAMLQSYATAVTNMRTAVSEGDPTSWLFQWYTHAVRGDRTKAGEITRIYPSASPDRSLAQDMWDTCQAHHPGDIEDFFLPWHRMFVYFFESIVRQASGDLNFTLPYWDYSAATPAVHGILPPEFRMMGDATYGSLYVDRRNAGANAGNPIDQGEPGNPLSLVALEECQYSSSGAVQGFNLRLDSGLHGNVHVLTGNSMNMGSVPWAAFDPIFWMHHCNIDRLWASWNAGGRTNPTATAWLDQTFVFATAGGTRVVAKVGDFDEIAPLNYQYDRLEPVPPCPATTTTTTEAAMRTMFRVESVDLGLARVAVGMGDMATTADAAPQSLRERVEGLGDRRLYLVARGLSAEVQPGVLYNIYLQVPSDMALADATTHYVGSVNFFSGSGHGGEHAAQVDADKFHSFDVTDLARKLMGDGLLAETPTLTIAPSGSPAAEAKPVVAELSLVEQ